MFILTEPTPNPDAVKFIPHARLTDGGAWAFQRTGFQPDRSPLAARLFALPDVASVFVAEDFVTVTRRGGEAAWSELRLEVIRTIADHLASGEAAVTAGPPDAEGLADADDIELEIREVLARWVKPGVAKDGGDVLFERFDAESGVLYIRMRGACGGCPSSRLTLKAGIERIVRRYVPEVLSVEEAVQPRQASAAKATDWKARLGAAVGGASGAARPIFTSGGRLLSNSVRRAS